MRTIPLNQRKEMEAIPFFNICAKAGLPGHTCEGKITWDHPLTFASKQLIEPNFTVPHCEYGHSVNLHQDGGDYDKHMSVWIALNRSTDKELQAISKAINYLRERERLNKIYGHYNEHNAIAAYKFIAKAPKLPVAEEDKVLWYKASPEMKARVYSMIEVFKKEFGITYTPWQMIDLMIEEFTIEPKAEINRGHNHHVSTLPQKD